MESKVMTARKIERKWVFPYKYYAVLLLVISALLFKGFNEINAPTFFSILIFGTAIILLTSSHKKDFYEDVAFDNVKIS